MRVSDEAISRLVRQQTDTRYRTMLTRLNRLYARLNADAKTHMGDASRPYDTATSDALFAPLPMRPAKSMTRATAPGLSDLAAEAPQSTPVADLRDMVNSGGPRLLRMVSLIRRNPVTVDRSDDRPGATLVDIAASFNRLPESERRESEIVGFLGGLGAVSGNAIADEPSTRRRRRRGRQRHRHRAGSGAAQGDTVDLALRIDRRRAPELVSLQTRCWPTWTS